MTQGNHGRAGSAPALRIQTRGAGRGVSAWAEATPPGRQVGNQLPFKLGFGARTRRESRPEGSKESGEGGKGHSRRPGGDGGIPLPQASRPHSVLTSASSAAGSPGGPARRGCGPRPRDPPAPWRARARVRSLSGPSAAGCPASPRSRGKGSSESRTPPQAATRIPADRFARSRRRDGWGRGVPEGAGPRRHANGVGGACSPSRAGRLRVASASVRGRGGVAEHTGRRGGRSLSGPLKHAWEATRAT